MAWGVRNLISAQESTHAWRLRASSRDAAAVRVARRLQLSPEMSASALCHFLI